MVATKKKSTGKAKKNYTKVDKYQQVTDKIIKLLDEGCKPWIKEWQGNDLDNVCRNIVSGHVYSGCNVFLTAIDIMFYQYSSSFFVGFDQASQNGWKIKKDSKATPILFANSFLKETEKDGEKTEERFFTHKWHNVFNLDCIDDSESDKKIADYIEKYKSEIIDNDNQPIELVDNFVKSIAPQLEHGGDRAYYNILSDKIVMPTIRCFTSSEAYYSTLLHELSHWTGHENRLNRNFGTDRTKEAYAFEELIAELGSAYLCDRFKVASSIENHASYLNSWIKILKEDNKAFFKAVSQANKVVSYLIPETRN